MKSSKLVVSLFVFGLIFMGIGALFAATYVSYHNAAVRAETNIERFYKDSQNVLSAYTLKVQEIAKVPARFKSDLQDIIKQTFEGRYGEDGSKAVFQFIKEQNMSLDSKLYQSIQVAIEAGRNEFKLSQTKKLDVCAGYENLRNSFVSGFFVSYAGFPKKDVNQMCTVIIDEQTDQTFKSGKATVINF